jgi:hypothetical protein
VQSLALLAATIVFPGCERKGVQRLPGSYYWLLLLPWLCTAFTGWQFWPIWRRAVRTGRWLVGSGRAYYFPSKHYTFTIYDRAQRPFSYWLGVISIPIIFLLFFLFSLLLTVAALWPL